MKNDKTSGDNPDMPWNTDDVMFGKLTCKQLSRLVTAYISMLRMTRSEYKLHGNAGVMNAIATMLLQQLELLNSPNLTEAERKQVEESSVLAILAVCMGAMFAVDSVDPRHLTAIGVAALDTVDEMANRIGPAGPDEDVVIKIRRGEEYMGQETIQMGVSLEPLTNLDKKPDNIAKQIKKVVKKRAKKLNPPDFNPGEQGPN